VNSQSLHKIRACGGGWTAKQSLVNPMSETYTVPSGETQYANDVVVENNGTLNVDGTFIIASLTNNGTVNNNGTLTIDTGLSDPLAVLLDYDEFAVYIGGLEPLYNIKTMVQAAKRGFNLVIAGIGSEKERVRQAAEKNANIQHLRCVDHDIVPGLLDLADCGICLVDDPHTVKTLEYGAAGLPFVHAKGRAEGHVPSQGVEFVTIDPDQIADAVERAPLQDTDRLKRWAADHDFETVVDDYEEMIKQCL